jgi:DTW domain-containing protein
MPSRSPRKACPACSRPVSHCLCDVTPNLVSGIQLVIIQHPSEQAHALNTARLLANGLLNAHLIVTERIDAYWEGLLLDPDWRVELLFPGEGVPTVQPVAQDLRPQRLVLLDGTWRKARKLLYLNPSLQRLPRVALPGGLTSRYRLRKAPQPGALSTVEAAVAALGLLCPGRDFSPLLAPFDKLVEGQIEAMGVARYQHNYRQSP